MDKIKDKYEIILGFVTLVVSLSAFKDELGRVTLELGYKTITLADYFLYIVYGFSTCLYFYVVERISRDTKIGNWKIFDLILRFAYFLFVLILLSPILIILNLISLKLYHAVANNLDSTEYFLRIVNIITTIFASIISIMGSTRLLKDQKRSKQEEIVEQEIKELENANKLFADGYYSHSIMEIFKVLEINLYKRLINKGIRVSRYRFNDIINLSLQEKIIDVEDLTLINKIKEMRNTTAHSDTVFTKSQAEFAFDFLKRLLQKNEK